jgi:putative membrane protein
MGLFVLRWLSLAIALAVTAWILPGVVVDSFPSLLVAALVLGFFNAVLRPLLVILTLPVTIITLGVFYLILNALLFSLASFLVPGFTVMGFGWAFLGAIIMGLLSMFLGAFAR